jgi:hypothetical protein
VCERERERENEYVCERERERVSVCMCVIGGKTLRFDGVRERESERE